MRFKRLLWMVPAIVATGCAEDPIDGAAATFSLDAAPDAIEVELGNEAASPVKLTSKAVYESHSRTEMKEDLTFFSSNPAVAVLASLTPTSGFSDYLFGSFSASSQDEAKLVVNCKKAGSATIRIDGVVTVAERYAFMSATQTLKDTTSFDVTCVVKVGLLCEPPEEHAVALLGEGLTGDSSALCGMVDGNVSSDPTVHSSDEVAAVAGAGDHTETYARVAAVVDVGSSDLLTCGGSAHGFTHCVDPLALPLAGEYVVVSNVLHEALPEQPGDYLTYGFVFDANGDPSDNYVADPAYPNDWFQGTDRWYQLIYEPGSGWHVSATTVDGDPLPLAGSQARIVVIDNSVSLLVPAHELSGAPDYRVTAFRHAGDWGFGGDWNGDVEPPVADGLASF